MRRTTVILSADLKARAMREAEARGISFGELVRRALRGEVDAPASACADPVLADHAGFEGASPEDLAEDHDGYLYTRRE